ncbi:hypothetical protein AAVH_31875, partial [Aphelenchoides avenae]
MGRKSTAKRLSLTTSNNEQPVPKLFFEDGNTVLAATEYFHLFSAFVRDYLDQMRPHWKENPLEVIRIPLPDADMFELKHVVLLMQFLETLKRQERDWFKKRFGKRPTLNDELNLVRLAPWAIKFFDRLEQPDLEGLGDASCFYDCAACRTYVAAYLAHKSQGMTVPEMRALYGLQDDFTPEDYEEMARHPRLRSVIEKDSLMPTLPGTSSAESPVWRDSHTNFALMSSSMRDMILR